jgi:citrate lyase subunit beta / citryl-CoA lyase
MYDGLAELERSWLFVPGDQPRLFSKALATTADAVILDLEDSVLPQRKAFARHAILEFLETTTAVRLWLRPNLSTRTVETLEQRLLNHPRLRGIVLPKADTPDYVARVRNALRPDAGLVVLIESASALVACPAIAHVPGVSRLCFGSVDFLSDIAGSHQDMTRHCLMQLVVFAREAGLPPPISGVTLGFRETAELEQETRDAISLGCFGKLCIHPSQVDAVNFVHLPNDERIAWARGVLRASADCGVFAYEGRMVDAPVLREAEIVLRLAARGSTHGKKRTRKTRMS